MLRYSVAHVVSRLLPPGHILLLLPGIQEQGGGRNNIPQEERPRKKRGLGDGTVGMFSWLVVVAIAG